MTKKKEKPTRAVQVSEQDLRQNFEKYQRIVEDLNRRYSVEPVFRGRPDSPDDRYTSEGKFVYEVHART